MNARHAVEQLRDVLASLTPPFTEDDVYVSMEQSGVPFEEADRAFKMSQVVCGRTLLRGLGIVFSDEYTFFNAGGEVSEAGSLSNEAYFAAAMDLVSAGRFQGSSFEQFSLMSAEVNAVNEALNSGSKPEDLVTMPLFLFSEAPTTAGMEKAQRTIQQQVARQQRSPLSEKPWWKIW